MRPETIRFTGLVLTPDEAIRPRKMTSGVYPAEWIRHQWLTRHEDHASLNFIAVQAALTNLSAKASEVKGLARLDRYIERKMEGRWGSYSVDTPEGTKYVVLFETDVDAVLFRLLDGDRNFLKPEDEW